MTMPSASPEQPIRGPGRKHENILAIFISLLLAGAAISGFLVGRMRTQDAFIKKVSGQPGSQPGTTLLSAGTVPVSQLQFHEKRLDDPLMVNAWAKAYGVQPATRAALFERLRKIPWMPPYQPAPFLGHVARPYSGDGLHINSFGFRDERASFSDKLKGTIRIFMTGGSVTYGMGASSEANTIPRVLERILNDEAGKGAGYRYEVVNTAFPGWSTTQEKILVQQCLVDLQPDIVLMFSGGNDVYWSYRGRDIRSFYTQMDQNFITLFNEAHKASGHPERAIEFPHSDQPIECGNLARVTARNVEEIAAATKRVNARVIFCLQPNIISTTKRLSQFEQKVVRNHNKAYWDSCYETLRVELSRVQASNYRMVDLSRSFGGFDENTELFIDSYHFVDSGHRLIAQDLAEEILRDASLPDGPLPEKASH
jgi:lysophospholipase L1-like esterase